MALQNLKKIQDPHMIYSRRGLWGLPGACLKCGWGAASNCGVSPLLSWVYVGVGGKFAPYTLLPVPLVCAVRLFSLFVFFVLGSSWASREDDDCMHGCISGRMHFAYEERGTECL